MTATPSTCPFPLQRPWGSSETQHLYRGPRYRSESLIPPMKIQFQCTCGADISEFTRGEGPDTDIRVVCGNCESMYVVTITQLLDGSEW